MRVTLSIGFDTCYTAYMNILYINGHPYDKSFHATIAKTFAGSVGQQHEVVLLHLGKENFDPVLRFGYSEFMKTDPFVTRSQELVQWADHIIFTFPMWWGDAPSLLRGWIERVMTPGYSYSFKGGTLRRLLKGKTADIIVTSRGFRVIAWPIGNVGVLALTHNVFMLSGIRRRRVLSLGGIGILPHDKTEQRKATFLRRIARYAQRL